MLALVWGELEGMASMGHEETFGGNEYVHYVVCGDDFMKVYICQNVKLYTLHM